MKNHNTDSSNSLLHFPCDFVLKVFGRASDTFEIETLSIIRAYVEDIPENAVKSRPSKDGKYLALTITLPIDSKEQLDAIYEKLSSNPEILMVL